ncbi:MAG: hypothetical protein JW891_16050 [Candidatus Lokiarchaeota archaeon]|nr:hypothetical protein [Candidatus Lokiarchaeota archaeon]
MSEAEIPIEIDFLGVGSVDATIIRHLGPISADAILNKMPFVLRGRFGFGSNKYWMLMNVGIRKGPDSKATKTIQKGDLAYNPKSDEIIIAIEDIEMPNNVNRIGKLVSNVTFFQTVRNGLNCKLSKK